MFSFFKVIPTITTQELAEKLPTNPKIVDVRTSSEYRGGHIRQAKNLPLAQINNYRGNQEETVYVICQSGMRRKRAVKKLRKAGYSAVNVRGGMNQWRGTKVRGK